ncbi:uncharacterized protein LOC144303961 [Canis aureus]
MNPGPLKRSRSGVGGVAWQSHQQPLCRASARRGGEGDGKSGGGGYKFDFPASRKRPGWERKRRRRKGWVRGRVRSPAEEEPGPSRRCAGVTRAKKARSRTRPPRHRHRHHAPELPLRLRLGREDAPIPPPPWAGEAPASPAFPPYPTQQAGHSSHPRPGSPLLPGRPGGRPPFPSPSRPHPRVQRGRGLPQAAASASSPRGSWCLPGPTGLTRTTQPQDVRSDGTTASCHAPPLPPPPASSPPRISPPTPPSRAQDAAKGDGGTVYFLRPGPSLSVLPPLPSFRNSTFLLNRSEVGLGGRGPEAGHGLGGGGGWTSGGNPQTQRSIENRKETMGGRSQGYMR